MSFLKIVLCSAAVLVAAAPLFAQEIPTDAHGLPMKADFHRANIRDLLLSVFKDRGSFAMDPKVHGKVSGHFEGLSLDIISEIVRRLHATLRVQNGVYLVVATDLPTRARLARDPADRTVVFSFQNCELSNALNAITLVANDGHSTSLDVKATGLVNLAGRYPTFDDAVRAVVDTAHKTLCISNGNYMVAEQVDPWTRTLTFSFNNEDIRDALRDLFRNVDVRYSIAPEVQGTISGSLQGSFFDVLSKVLNQVQGTYRVQSGVFDIVKIPNKQVAGPFRLFETTTVLRAPRKWLPPELDKIVMPGNLSFKEINVQDVLATVFGRVPNAGTYRIEAGITKKISVDLSGKSLENALDTIAISAGTLVSLENGVFVFRKNRYAESH